MMTCQDDVDLVVWRGGGGGGCGGGGGGGGVWGGMREFIVYKACAGAIKA